MRNILIVTTRFPWPLNNGFSKKNYAMVEGLSHDFNIHLVVVDRKKPDAEAFSKVSRYCHSIHFFKPDLLDFLYSFVSFLIRDYPLQFSLFYSRKAKRHIENSFDFIDTAICSVVRSAPYFTNFKGKLLNDLADSLGQVYKKDAPKFKGINRFIYREEGRRLIAFEKKLIERSYKTFYFNKSEAAFFNSPKVDILTHGIDNHLFDISGIDSLWSDGIVFFGKMDFAPNVDAISWFVENVLYQLDNSIRLYVVGFNPSQAILSLANKHPRVTVTGFVENPYPAMRGAIATICPIQIGGGIQNKVLESMAIGTVTIVSKLAATPFKYLDQSGLLVCSTPEEWANTITSVKRMPRNYDVNKTMGISYVKKHYSWELYIKQIKENL